jgi:hypothetical protein
MPTGQVDHLEIFYHGGDEDVTINTSLLKCFPSLTSLTLDQVCYIKFGLWVNIPTLKQLTIMTLRGVDIQFRPLMDTFPNVEELTLQEIQFAQESIGDVNLPKLRSLKMWCCSGIPWRDLKLPRISHFSYGGLVTDDVVAFISSHQTIQHLGMTYARSHTNTAISSSPQVTNLTIELCEELCDRTQLKLSNLQNLTLYHYGDRPVSLELFEQLVRSRFLPPQKSAETMEAAKATPSLTILVEYRAKWEEIEWLACPLISSASEEVEENVESLDGLFNSYTFTWM